MFYAKGNVSQKLDVYLALLEKTIGDSSSSSGYRTFFTAAFKNAHDLAVGSKSYFDLDNDLYDVVDLLLRDNEDYFKRLDISKIDDSVFLDVKNFMGSLRQSNSLI
jgi:hypothetical protein